MTRITWKNKNNRIITWMIGYSNISYEVILNLDKNGKFVSLKVPEITDVNILYGLEHVLEAVNIILVHGVNYFLKDERYGKTQSL